MKEEFRDQYVKSLEEKVGTMDLLETKFLEGNDVADQNIRNLAHALHGSGSTFGFPLITRASAALEQANEEELIPRMHELRQVLEKIIAGYAVAAQARVSTRTEHPRIDKAADEKLVLVIENDPDTLERIIDCLKQQPGKNKTVVARDGMEAEEKLLRGEYDLIILDLVLPDKDGREILQEIKVYFQIPVPVIVLSGITNDVVRIDCISLGADRYVNKPVDPEKLSGDIGRLLAGEEKISLSLVPLDESAGDGEAAGDGAPRPLAGKTILVADDDEHLGQLISHLLTDQGASVQYADNGRKAVDMLRMSSCALVILDLAMPDMDGFAVLEKIRGELDLKGLPVIILAALGGEADIIRAYDMGVNDYILKPFSEVYLVARVKSLLKHHQAGPPPAG